MPSGSCSLPSAQRRAREFQQQAQTVRDPRVRLFGADRMLAIDSVRSRFSMAPRRALRLIEFEAEHP